MVGPRGCLRFDDGLCYQFSGSVSDRPRNACLMYVHANILFLVHGGVLLSISADGREDFVRSELFSGG